MRINVAGMLKGPVGQTATYNINSELEMEKEGKCPLTGVANLQRTGKGVLVSARFQTQVTAVCSRCLRPFPTPLSVEVEEEFLAPSYLRAGRTAQGEEPADFVIGEDQVLDLEDAFRQYILMALPMKPLCRPLCLGLCPQCGQDLNQGPCPHRAATQGY